MVKYLIIHKETYNNMKKYFLIFITIFLIISSSFTVSAIDTVSFELSNCNCDKNRLFTVNMIAQSDIKLSAATFEFTYNQNLFEFRSIKTTDENSQISYNELNNGVKAVFLNAFGQDISSKEIIFTLTFKSINSGTGNINFSVSECVSPDIQFVDIGTCTSSTVTINSTNSEEQNNRSTKPKKETETSETKKSEEETEVTTLSTIDELGILNPIDNWDTRYFFMGLWLGIAFVSLVILIYFISQRIINKFKNNNNKSSDS